MNEIFGFSWLLSISIELLINSKIPKFQIPEYFCWLDIKYYFYFVPLTCVTLVDFLLEDYYVLEKEIFLAKKTNL